VSKYIPQGGSVMNFFKQLFHKNNEVDQAGNKKKQKAEKKRFEYEQKVNDYFAYLLTIYNDYVDQYNKNKAIRDLINNKTEAEAYIRNIDNGIRLSQKAYNQISSAPYVYEIPKSIQQYMSACKQQFLLNLEQNINRDEVIKKVILNENENENYHKTMEHANELLAKADQHLDSAMNYMQKARENVVNM
jgi:hypothetical protein